MNKPIDMKTLIERLENINEDRFDSEVKEERERSISSLAHIIAAEVYDILKEADMPHTSSFAHKAVRDIIKKDSAKLNMVVQELLNEYL